MKIKKITFNSQPQLTVDIQVQDTSSYQLSNGVVSHNSCVLGTSSGIHPHHSSRYFRRSQANKSEFALQHFKSVNPIAVEESVWSANKTDDVITFLCEVPYGAKVKNKMSAIDLLHYVKLTQNNWVEEGTNEDLCVVPYVRNNVSNTITVKDDEWDEVEKFIYRNRRSFAGISLLPFSGDKDYEQAPFCAIYDPTELIKMYGDAAIFASGLIVDGLAAFKSLYLACDTLLGRGVKLEVPDTIMEFSQTYREAFMTELALRKDWIRRGIQFADRYFKGDIRHMTYCLKDVSNWKKWCDLSREYKEVDWVNLTEDSYHVQADSIAASGCSGGKCDIV